MKFICYIFLFHSIVLLSSASHLILYHLTISPLCHQSCLPQSLLSNLYLSTNQHILKSDFLFFSSSLFPHTLSLGKYFLSSISPTSPCFYLSLLFYSSLLSLFLSLLSILFLHPLPVSTSPFSSISPYSPCFYLSFLCCFSILSLSHLFSDVDIPIDQCWHRTLPPLSYCLYYLLNEYIGTEQLLKSIIEEIV